MHLKHKTIIITGGSRGLGREIVAQLAKEKCNIVIASRTQPDILNCLKKHGINAIWVKADVSNEKQFEKVFVQAKKKFRKIDALLNNAGVLFHKPLSKTDFKEIDLTLDVNIRGVVTGCKLAKKYIKKGIIINTASVAGLPGHGRKDISVYNASKFAILGFTEAIGDEYKPDIIVYAIAPYRMATGMSKFMGNHPRDIAKVFIKILKGKTRIKPGQYIIAGTKKQENLKRPELRVKKGDAIMRDCFR